VAVWERYLAYAAALGAADEAVHAIPMGADDDRRAWSSRGGRWREVRIRYPRLWPPGWGWRPWVALLLAMGGGLVAALLLRAASAIGWPKGGGLGFPDELVTVVRVLAVALWMLGGLAALWAAQVLLRAVGDLGSPRRVGGLVIRKRERGGSNDSEPRFFVALDEGRAARLRAYRVRRDVYHSCPPEHQEATATVTRFLGHVTSIRAVLPEPPAS
jgi:hypothetical protein